MSSFLLPENEEGIMLGAAVLFYKSMGWSPVLLPAGERNAPAAGPDYDIGVMLGERSGDLIGFEFCWGEAQEVGDALLSALPSFGPDSATHKYRVARGRLANDFQRFEIPASAAHLFAVANLTVLKLAGDGHQLIAPPSVNVHGESLAWNDEMDDPIEMYDGDPESMAGLVATLAVVLHFYRRTSGNRENVCLALMGALARAGSSERFIADVMSRFVALAREEPRFDFIREAALICEHVDADDSILSVSDFCEELGIEPMVGTLRRWLGISVSPGGGGGGFAAAVGGGQAGGEHHG